jgi:hypothetical protein
MVKTYLHNESNIDGWDKIWRAKPIPESEMKEFKVIEVLKKSEVEKEIKIFEKKHLTYYHYDDSEEWQDFKNKLLGVSSKSPRNDIIQSKVHYIGKVSINKLMHSEKDSVDVSKCVTRNIMKDGMTRNALQKKSSPDNQIISEKFKGKLKG